MGRDYQARVARGSRNPEMTIRGARSRYTEIDWTKSRFCEDLICRETGPLSTWGGPTILELFRVVARIDSSSDTNDRLDDLIRSQPNDTSDLPRNRRLSVADVGLRRLLRIL